MGHRSILAIAPSHRLGFDSILGILEPRWWVALPNPSFEPETHRRPHSLPEVAPKPGQKAQTKGNGGYTPRAA